MKKTSAQKSPSKTLVLITLVITGILVALFFLNNAKTPQTNQTVAETEPPAEGQPFLGNEEAPITVVEFGDFKCPACKAWGETVYPELVKDYVDTGKVKFVYINVLFHGQESILGSLAAETVWKQAPEQYWSFHKALFDAQPAQQNHDDPWLTADKLIEIAGGIDGINMKKFQDSLEQASEQAEVKKDDELVKEFNVELTPTIMVENVMLEDPFDYEKIKSLIEEKLAGS